MEFLGYDSDTGSKNGDERRMETLNWFITFVKNLQIN
jgi:hypothetical protein